MEYLVAVSSRDGVMIHQHFGHTEEFQILKVEDNERYHFLDFVSSQSTMHRIAKFDLDGQYSEYTDPRCIEVVKELVARYNETKDPADYLRILYSNPCGFRLTAGMTTNYRQLKTIYAQRKNHRLPEWREFCQWIRTLPMAEKLIVNGQWTMKGSASRIEFQ